MLETLNDLDTQLFYWINGHHNSMLDWTMWSMSQHWCWLAVLVLAYCLTALRREPRQWWIALVGIALCFLLADQGSVHLFKDTVCRLRPCHALDNVRMFQTRCGGQYGFVSSHAANAFAIVSFIWLRYRRWEGKRKCRALAVPVCMLFWALATCYSRVYLGKHYPGDIIGGALFGIIVGWLVWLLTGWIEKKYAHRETK